MSMELKAEELRAMERRMATQGRDEYDGEPMRGRDLLLMLPLLMLVALCHYVGAVSEWLGEMASDRFELIGAWLLLAGAVVLVILGGVGLLAVGGDWLAGVR
jgi:hypothetical protein